MRAEWFQIGPIVARLAAEGSPSCVATVEALMRKPDPGVRKEVVAGLAQVPGPVADRLLPELVKDENADVAIAAARVLAKGATPGAGAFIAARLSQLDIDNSDYELARELIFALSICPDQAAGAALTKLNSRRSLMKRGHFNDIQQAVGAALQARAQGVNR
jgi:HEAT repeat protein